MRVMIVGSDIIKINPIAVKTFLNGLKEEYQDDLYLIYKGYGYISDIVDKWIDIHWPGSASRKCHNVEWLIKKWSDDLESAGYVVIDETRPDLIITFGYDECDFVGPAQHRDIPIFYMEKL